MLLLVFKDEIINRIFTESLQDENEIKLFKKVKAGEFFILNNFLNQDFTVDERKYFINPLNW